MEIWCLMPFRYDRDFPSSDALPCLSALRLPECDLMLSFMTTKNAMRNPAQSAIRRYCGLGLSMLDFAVCTRISESALSVTSAGKSVSTFPTSFCSPG